MEQQERMARLPQLLLPWYQDHHRDLPWRADKDPYHIWISEIMLQQTRVEAVKGYYARFLETLPTVADLALCDDDVLHKLWEGLGYYSRVRNLKKAACQIVEQYQGIFPGEYDAWRALPGVGEYTAGAICSIAFDLPTPAVDGNVLRVLARIHDDDTPIDLPVCKKKAQQQLEQIYPKQAGEFTQAMMELGATVCVPNGMAHCEECPLAFMCRAKEEGRVLEFPKKAAKKPRKIEERTVFIIRSEEKTAIGQRPKKGLLAGLYELPNVLGKLTQEEALEYVKGLGFSPIRILPLTEAKHIFSHVEWHMTGYVIRVEEEECSPAPGFSLIDPKETEAKYPIPTAFQAYTKYLDIKIGYEVHEKK